MNTSTSVYFDIYFNKTKRDSKALKNLASKYTPIL